MIYVEMDKNSIACQGHSKDLICNTVSTLMWALSITLEQEKAKDMVVIEGDGQHMVECLIDDTTRPIMDGFKACFRLLEEQFSDEIKVSEDVSVG